MEWMRHAEESAPGGTKQLYEAECNEFYTTVHTAARRKTNLRRRSGAGELHESRARLKLMLDLLAEFSRDWCELT